jgi:hypothetical protein
VGKGASRRARHPRRAPKGGHACALPTLRVRHPWPQHRRHAATIPRRVCARVMRLARPSKFEEGAGNAGCTTHPQPCVQLKKARSKSPQVRRNTGIPCTMVLTATPRFPRCTGLSSHRRFADHPRNLTPASGDQDHATSPSASATIVSRSLRVHRIPAPRFVTIGRNVPLFIEAGCAEIIIYF